MYYIIVNPVAGRGRTMSRLPALEEMFKSHGAAYQVHVTEKFPDGYEATKKFCADENCTGIIGMGGDGTFQEIAAGMVDAFPQKTKIPIPLGIFPAGSGNDFIMTVEGGKKQALAKYKKDTPTLAKNFFDVIKGGKTRAVDVITANGTAFLNIGCMGLDARITRNAVELKPKYGRHGYLAAVYKSIAQHKNLPLIVEVNGKKLDKPFTLAAICNGQYYGGGLHIAPPAKIDDGKITLCLIDEISRIKLMTLFPSLMFSKHGVMREVTFIECEEVAITIPSDVGTETLCLDGNLYPREGRLEFKILPKILDVFV